MQTLLHYLYKDMLLIKVLFDVIEFAHRCIVLVCSELHNLLEIKFWTLKYSSDLFASPFHRIMQSPNLVAARPHFQMLFSVIYVFIFRPHSYNCILQCKLFKVQWNEWKFPFISLPMANVHCYLICVNKSSAQIHFGF